ncbi:MAG: hypothetical protein OHK0012_11670 [Synechococcales cyanobacterium]
MGVISLRLALTLPVVVGVSLSSGITAWLFYRHEQESHLTLLDGLTRRTQAQIKHDLDEYLAAPHRLNQINAQALALNQLPAPDSRDPQPFQSYFREQLQLVPSVTMVSLGTNRGGLVGVARRSLPEPAEAFGYFHTTNLAAGQYVAGTFNAQNQTNPAVQVSPSYDARLRPWYQAAVNHRGPTWSPVYSFVATKPILGISAVLAVRDPQQQVLGVLTADLDLTHTQQVLQSWVRDTPLTELWIIERSGLLVASARDEPLFQEHGDPTNLQRLAITDSPDPRTQAMGRQVLEHLGSWEALTATQSWRLTLQQHPYQAIVFPLRDPYGLDWLVVAGIPLESWQQTQAYQWLFGASAIIILVGIGVGTATSQMVSRTIERLSQQTQSLALGQDTQPLPQGPPIEELQRIQMAFNQLLAQFSRSLQDIFNTSPGTIYIYNLPTQELVFCNPRQWTLLGYAPGSPLPPFAERLHPDDHELLAQHRQKLAQAKDQEVISQRYRERHAQGHYCWLQVYEVVFRRDDQGSPVEILGTAIDITETQSLTAELAASEQRFHALLSNLNVGVVFHGLQTEIQFFNPAALELLGLSAEQLLGKTSYDPSWQVVREDNSPYPLAEIPALQVLASGQPCHNVVLGVYRPEEANPIWLLVNGDPVWDSQGQLAGALVSFMDISVRRQAEVVLLQRDQALTSLARERTLQLEKAMTLTVLSQKITEHLRATLDEKEILQRVVDGLVPSLNLTFADIGIYDMARQEARITYECTTLESSSVGHVIPFSFAWDNYQQLLAGSPVQVCFLDDYPHSPSPQRYFLKLACPIRDEHGTWADLWCARHDQVVFSDQEIAFVMQLAATCAIAVRQARLYTEAQAQVKELEHLNYLKDDFISTVSHELRTPLTSMRLAIRMMQLTQKQWPLAEKQQRYMDTLELECEREISIVNDLLDLQRLNVYGSELSIRPITLSEWLPTMTGPFLLRMESQQQPFSLICPVDLPEIWTDEALLARIIRELMTNACKYTPTQQAIRLEVHQEDSQIILTVFNGGTHIPEPLLERIFDRFFRIPDQDRWKQGGTGLGLALCQQMIHILQGSLTAENRPDGVAFTLRLPLTLSPHPQSQDR